MDRDKMNDIRRKHFKSDFLNMNDCTLIQILFQVASYEYNYSKVIINSLRPNDAYMRQ